MLFKGDGLDEELAGAHPEIQRLAYELDAAVQEWGLGPLVITDVMRTPAFYRNPDAWSWHFVGCAIDFRSWHLPPIKKLLVLDWLKKRCPKADGWDVVYEPDAKRGEHFHVEFEDEGLKRDWFSKRAAGVA